jgi:hypothetical protein
VGGDQPIYEDVGYGSELLGNVREVADHVDATFDAAGKGGLEEAITLTGDKARVITLGRGGLARQKA